MDRIGAELASWKTAALCLCIVGLRETDPDKRLKLLDYAHAVLEVAAWARDGWLAPATRDPRSPGARDRELSWRNSNAHGEKYRDAESG